MSLLLSRTEPLSVVDMVSVDDICTYSLAVITSLVGVMLVLLAGYQRYEDPPEEYAEYLPAFTAIILIVMGIGFILGIF